MTITECRSCGAPIVWCFTTGRKSIPVDADPSPEGNIIMGELVMNYRSELVPQAIVLSGADIPLGDPPRYLSHFATCPDADSWRKR